MTWSKPGSGREVTCEVSLSELDEVDELSNEVDELSRDRAAPQAVASDATPVDTGFLHRFATTCALLVVAAVIVVVSLVAITATVPAVARPAGVVPRSTVVAQPGAVHVGTDAQSRAPDEVSTDDEPASSGSAPAAASVPAAASSPPGDTPASLTVVAARRSAKRVGVRAQSPSSRVRGRRGPARRRPLRAQPEARPEHASVVRSPVAARGRALAVRPVSRR